MRLTLQSGGPPAAVANAIGRRAPGGWAARVVRVTILAATDAGTTALVVGAVLAGLAALLVVARELWAAGRTRPTGAPAAAARTRSTDPDDRPRAAENQDL